VRFNFSAYHIGAEKGLVKAEESIEGRHFLIRISVFKTPS